MISNEQDASNEQAQDAGASEDAGTRERLLKAAGAVFAEKGFRGATVREIVARAGANLNAVNYYFRDKHGLYFAVFEDDCESAKDDEDLQIARNPDAEASERLRAFVRSFLLRALMQDQGFDRPRLMAMEMAEPTPALDDVVDRFIRPRFELLMTIVRDVVGDRIPQPRVDLCVESIVGQCVHLIIARPIITRLIPSLSYTPEDVTRMIDHVTTFSLAALKNLPSSDEGTA